MAKRKFYHVVPDSSGQWLGKLEGETLPVVVAPTKDKAIEMTVAEAKNNKPSSVKIHKANGQIENEWTYGDDPYPPKG